MATYRPPFDSTPATASQDDEDDEENTPSRPLSGPGTSRQTRRLQLRNAGFRGVAVPPRKVTPKSNPSSSWSTVLGSSDVENVSPSGKRQTSVTTQRRRSSGILQEIGNSTVTRPKKSRPRISSAKLFAREVSGDGGTDLGLPSSPTVSKSTVRPRPVKSRARASLGRRSTSAEASKYIEHLETELAATQSQLSSVTSPSVTRVQNSKMRTMNADTRRLQEEVAEWESKYDQRVQEEVDKHYTIESGLHTQIRNLEQDVEETRFKVRELETQLDGTAQSMEVVEAANVNLERRLEIMSELLAASPSKIDLHAQTAGRSRRPERPKSMLPRFPTASSLIGSPSRQPQTQPASPLLSFSNQSPSIPDVPNHSIMQLDTSPEQSDYMSEAESVFSEASIAGDSMTSTENFDAQANFNPWSLPPPPTARTKPTRRMRRFGAGSLGPKPLILPATSHCENFPPASAPPLDRSETAPAFFPSLSVISGDSRTPLLGRRRASTIANEMTVPRLAPSPLAEGVQQAAVDCTTNHLSTPSSANSHATTQHFPSLGSAAGRNLMEELTAVRSESSEIRDSYDGYHNDFQEQRFETPTHAEEQFEPSECSAAAPSPASSTEDATAAEHSDLSIPPSASVTAVADHCRSRSRSISTPILGLPFTAFDRLRTLFGDLWRSPLALARHLVQTAQARMSIPRPLQNVQWWLVGVLLGPLARRHMLTRVERYDDVEEQLLQLTDTPRRDAGVDRMAYGTFYETPPGSPNHKSDRLVGRDKRRAVNKVRCISHRRKHSPWLWIKFSITLAFAIGVAFKDGPGSLLKRRLCSCDRKDEVSEVVNDR